MRRLRNRLRDGVFDPARLDLNLRSNRISPKNRRTPLRPAEPRIYSRPPMPGASVQTPVAVPERTHSQRMRALQRANEIRTQRAKLKRDLKAGKAKIETLLLDPPEYVMSAKAFDMILAVPEVRAREGEPDPQPVPDLAEQDDRRAVGAPTGRARRPASPLEPLARGEEPPLRRSSSQDAQRGEGLRDHRPLRSRQGDADPRAAGARRRARALDLGDDTRAAPGRERRARIPLPRAARSSIAGSRPATSSSPRPTATTATGRCARRSTAASTTESRSCSRSSSRARARFARRCRSRSRSSSPRPRRRT